MTLVCGGVRGIGATATDILHSRKEGFTRKQCKFHHGPSSTRFKTFSSCDFKRSPRLHASNQGEISKYVRSDFQITKGAI